MRQQVLFKFPYLLKCRLLKPYQNETMSVCLEFPYLLKCRLLKHKLVNGRREMSVFPYLLKCRLLKRYPLAPMVLASRFHTCSNAGF